MSEDNYVQCVGDFYACKNDSKYYIITKTNAAKAFQRIWISTLSFHPMCEKCLERYKHHIWPHVWKDGWLVLKEDFHANESLFLDLPHDPKITGVPAFNPIEHTDAFQRRGYKERQVFAAP